MLELSMQKIDEPHGSRYSRRGFVVVPRVGNENLNSVRPTKPYPPGKPTRKPSVNRLEYHQLADGIQTVFRDKRAPARLTPSALTNGRVGTDRDASEAV